jgi:hypothetical protein
MLWLIKWTVIIFLFIISWFSYDYITHLDPQQKQELKAELFDTVDNNNNERFKGPMVQKFKEEFVINIKTKVKNVISKVLD